MRAAPIAFLLMLAVSAAAAESTDYLPPVDATHADDIPGGSYVPRRLPPADRWNVESTDCPWDASVTASAFENAPYRPGWDGPQPAILPATYPRSLTEPLLEDVPDDPFPAHVSSYKESVFQKLSFTGAWLNRSNPGDVGVTQLELFGVLAFPMPTTEKPLVITPVFSTYFVDGPDNPGQDLPPQLYDAYLEFRWINKINDRWLFDLAIAPGVYSDFEQWSSSALRFTGRGIAVYNWSPRMKLVLGVIYLDRDDVSMLPAAGIIWTPTDDWSLELVSPRPRIARRFFYNGQREDWIYIGGELGGGSWSVERANATPDVLTSRDYRVLLGVERKRPGGAGARFEVGWVFSREYEYASDPAAITQADATVMLRGGIVY